MAPNPVLLFGLVTGIVGAVIVYRRHNVIKDTVIAFVLCFLAFATPLHHVIVGVYLGIQVNQRIFKRWSNNWGAFLLSLIGIVPLSAIWYITIQPILALVVGGIDNPGGVIVLGTGTAAILVIMMLVGCGFYLLASLFTSFKRRNKLNPEALEPDNV